MTVKSIRCGNEDGIACGPMSGCVVSEVVVDDGGKTIYVTASEFDGFKRITVTEKPVYEMWFEDDSELTEHPMACALEDYEPEEEDEYSGSGYLKAIQLAVRLIETDGIDGDEWIGKEL